MLIDDRDSMFFAFITFLLFKPPSLLNSKIFSRVFFLLQLLPLHTFNIWLIEFLYV